MEEIPCEVRVVMRECAAHIVILVSARLHELLELRNDRVVASLSVHILAEPVVDFLPPVE